MLLSGRLFSRAGSLLQRRFSDRRSGYSRASIWTRARRSTHYGRPTQLGLPAELARIRVLRYSLAVSNSFTQAATCSSTIPQTQACIPRSSSPHPSLQQEGPTNTQFDPKSEIRNSGEPARGRFQSPFFFFCAVDKLSSSTAVSIDSSKVDSSQVRQAHVYNSVMFSAVGL